MSDESCCGTVCYGDGGRRVLLVRLTESGPEYSPEAVSLWTGVAADLIRAEVSVTGVTSIEALPLAWVQAARRRAAEAATITGTRNALVALYFYAWRDHGVELQLDDAGVWMPRPEVLGG